MNLPLFLPVFARDTKTLALFLNLVQKRIKMKLAALIDAASDEIGVKPSEAKTRARFMREHGFLRSGGRGKGAAEMQPDDLAAILLGLNSFSEPTGTGYALRDLSRAKFDYCEWVDLTALEEGLATPEGERKMPYRWFTAPLPASYGDVLQSDDLIKVLATSLFSMKKASFSNRLESLQSESHPEGLSWKIEMSEKTSQVAMRERYVEFSGDASDAMRFTNSNKEHFWRITASFRLIEKQQDQREVKVKIDGDMIAHLVAACAENWEEFT